MNLNKSTLYALYAAMEMAQAGDDGVVTAGAVGERYRVPEAVVAKVLQQLARSGLAEGIRGVGGGYRLARPAAAVTVLDVIEVFQPSSRPAASAPEPNGAARLGRLLAEVDEVTRATFASTSLETLVGR